MASLNALIHKLKEHYDKIMAFLALVILFGSLIYLAVNIGLIKRMQVDFNSWIKALRPSHPNASVVSSDMFDFASDNLERPIQLDHHSWTNRGFFPESRMSCKDCRRPVPIMAKTCPYCGEEIDKAPPPPEDSDKDGMKDDWEKEYGLDRFNPDDAELDNDSDGFTNLEEYNAKTNPVDPTEHPSNINKLRLEKIHAEPFRLQFKSRVKTPDGTYKFGLNYRTRRDMKTTFAKIGEVVEGFTLTDYQEKHKTVEKPFKRKVDVSELTLKRGTQTIVLTKDQARLHVELTVHFFLDLPENESKYQAGLGNSFDFDEDKYKVIEIDREDESVVILSSLTKTRFAINSTSSETIIKKE